MLEATAPTPNKAPWQITRRLSANTHMGKAEHALQYQQIILLSEHSLMVCAKKTRQNKNQQLQSSCFKQGHSNVAVEIFVCRDVGARLRLSSSLCYADRLGCHADLEIRRVPLKGVGRSEVRNPTA